MSRFFRQAGDSDSDTESSEDELMSSDEEAPAAKPAAKPAMSRFLKGAASDSSSSSDSDSDSDEDDESDVPKKGKGMNAFANALRLRGTSSSLPYLILVN